MRIQALLGALLLTSTGGAARLEAAKLVSVGVVDKDYLVVHLQDGEVDHNESSGQKVIRYTPELSVPAATQTASWRLRTGSAGDPYAAGLNPIAVHRKKKLSGHAQMQWSGRDYAYESTYEHWIYLKLPHPLTEKVAYTLEIAPAVNAGATSASVTFDVYNSVSEAIHVNLVGYANDSPHFAADLYQWLGDGGARDYSGSNGAAVYLYEVGAIPPAQQVGSVSIGSDGGPDVNAYDLTRSDVWHADFLLPANLGPGTYRLVVDGVGCSRDFTIGDTAAAYAEPFRLSLRGYYYMRIGQKNPTGLVPPPRTPLYIPGESPANTRVYLTSMQPWHPRWGSFSGGDPWDKPDDWAAYRLPGDPTNNDAWGGHSDAYDWDRHLGHVSNVYDMLLPYVLTGGRITDDDTGLTESGNGIPDLLDEAQNEVDFWLRLRTPDGGYSHGLTNPNGNNELFQAGPTPMAAWANAANAAMLAYAYRLAGKADLEQKYLAAARAAYAFASALADPMLDATQNIGEGTVRGRDLRLTAAAYLYNLTGTSTYHDTVVADSVVKAGAACPAAGIENASWNQTWAVAGYLVSAAADAALKQKMSECVIAEAMEKEVALTGTRPSRRATDERTGYFRTIQNVQRTMIAHAITSGDAQQPFRKALDLEAGWGLGRNPMNIIEMTTWTTPLARKRSIEYMYTTGRDDGVPGLHPGHTPYLNLDDWYTRMTMGSPSKLYAGGYPADFKGLWPIGEGYFNSPWVWAHSEFTPQQTMRGKMALYAYLYGLGPSVPNADTFLLTVAKTGIGSGTVTSDVSGIICGADCTQKYADGTEITLTATAAFGSDFEGWLGAAGCGPALTCKVQVSGLDLAVSAAFKLNGQRCTHPTATPPDLTTQDCDVDVAGATRIEAENYDTGGEGVGYHDTDAINQPAAYRTDGVDIEPTLDAGGGYNVSHIAAGEWLEYTIDVEKPGKYDVTVRAARKSRGTANVKVLFDGVDKTGSLTIPSTGGWQAWTSVTASSIELAAGRQVMRVSLSGGHNLNWIEITPVIGP